MRDLIRLYREPAAVEPVAPPATPVEPPVAAPAQPAPGSAAAPVVTAPGTASTTLDINKATATPIEPTFVLPNEYKDKVYLKGVDSQEKLLKMLDGAQELLGRKGPAVPKADAPQAEKDAYYEALGRPKDPAGYELPGADKGDPKFTTALRGVFHKYGLSGDAAKGIWNDVQGALGEFVKDSGLATQQANIDFDKLATDSFGTERDAVLTRGKELITANISPAMKPAIDKLDNNALIVLADVLRNVDKKYIKQDGPGRQPTIGSGTPDELRAKARGLMSEQAKHTPTSVEFTNLQTQIDGIYDSLRKSGVRL